MNKLHDSYYKAKKFYADVRARVFEVLQRIYHAYRIFRMRFLILIIPTHVNLPESFLFNEKKAANRGRIAPDGNYYSSSYELEWSAIPEEIKHKIKSFNSVLRLYFGGDYLIDTANVWRNEGLPDNFRSLDIYSQIWHYDRVVDYRNIQLFVLLTDTTEMHGAFEFIENSSESVISQVAEERNGLNLNEGTKFTGLRGDAMFFSTGAVPHRAGIPVFGNYRDIFSITFFPKYTKIGTDANFLLRGI
jgi:hypothetical protein